MDLSNYNKILIIRLSSLGDILLTTPFIRTIKILYPQIKIDFVVRKEFEDAIKYNPYISNIISVNRNYDSKKFANNIAKNKYNLIIDLQNNIRSRSLVKKAETKIVRYKKPYINRILLVKFKLNRFKQIIPIPERYANSIKDFKLDEKGLELFLPDSFERILDTNKKYIGFCPGSQHKTKMWPKEYFEKLGKKLTDKGFTILLLGGKSDKQICKELNQKIKDSIDISNDNKLLELGYYMKKCEAVICNDSGLMHTALAVNVPVVAIFGSTVKELGFFPYKGKNVVLENNSLSCRPCSHIGLDECPKKHLDCLNKITPQFVLENTLEFIK